MGLENTAKEVLETILEKLGLAAQVKADSDEEGVITLEMVSSKQGVLIGYHGENLEALQLLVRTIVYRLTGEWPVVVVDIAGYRAQRSEKLRQLAVRQAEKVRFLSTEIALPPMSAGDRREIHLAVAQIEGVESESVGEGRERRVVVRPAAAKKASLEAGEGF